MNGNDIVEYMEKHGTDLLMEFYDITEEEAENMDWYDKMSDDSAFRQYVEEGLAEAYRGEEAKEESLIDNQ